MVLPDETNARRGLDLSAVKHGMRRLALAEQPPWLHAEVARRLSQRLEIIRMKPSLVLDWSGFLGAGAEVLQDVYPNARRVTVEPTPDLAARSSRASATPWWSTRRWSGGKVEVAIESVSDLPKAQLVWSNMVLHAAHDPPALFERWQDLLETDGFVMFSCLGPGTLRQLRALYERLGWGPPTQGFIDMHDLGDMLVRAGFADPVMDQETIRLQWSEPQALLAELRTLGGNAAPHRTAGLRTPRWRDRLRSELEGLRDSSGKIGLDFEVAYGHAFKAAARSRKDQPTTVSLDTMRGMLRSARTRS